PEGSGTIPYANVLYFGEHVRASLGVVPVRQLVGWTHQAWSPPGPHAETFFPAGQLPSPEAQRQNTVRLVEGAGGYRRNALRSNFDCLMRRVPAVVAFDYGLGSDLPVQAPVPFC